MVFIDSFFKKVIYITIVLSFLISCKKKEELKNENIPIWKVELDTILEENNPETLDLKKHQLFIDTTRTSKFYKKYLSWKPSKIKSEAVLYHLAEISKRYKPKNINLGGFPKLWVSLEKLNNTFVVYDPCDGNTTSFEITNNGVIFYYQLEPDADVIYELKSIADNSIELELRTHRYKSKAEKTNLIITPTKHKDVYLLKYDFGEWYVTPREKVSEFDLVINHCPRIKRMEFKGFDSK